jgi:hypothetical protein
MAPDFDRLARSPWPEASLTSSGTSAFSSALARSWSTATPRVNNDRGGGAATWLVAQTNSRRNKSDDPFQRISAGIVPPGRSARRMRASLSIL